MAEKEFMTYNGFPLVKNGNTIYYGNFYDDFIVEMTVLASKTVGDTEVPSKISIRLMSTDESLSPSQRTLGNPVEKKSMNDAVQIAYMWLSKKVKPAE